MAFQCMAVMLPERVRKNLLSLRDPFRQVEVFSRIVHPKTLSDLGFVQVDIKRSVPRESMEIVKGPRYKKVFVGGIPASVGEGERKPKYPARPFFSVFFSCYL